MTCYYASFTVQPVIDLWKRYCHISHIHVNKYSPSCSLQERQLNEHHLIPVFTFVLLELLFFMEFSKSVVIEVNLKPQLQIAWWEFCYKCWQVYIGLYFVIVLHTNRLCIKFRFPNTRSTSLIHGKRRGLKVLKNLQNLPVKNGSSFWFFLLWREGKINILNSNVGVHIRRFSFSHKYQLGKESQNPGYLIQAFFIAEESIFNELWPQFFNRRGFQLFRGKHLSHIVNTRIVSILLTDLKENPLFLKPSTEKY